MILLLLLVLAASQVTEADFKPCPDDSACLYHARCSRRSKTGENVLATINPENFESWAATCKKSYTTTELYIRPLSNHQWNFTIAFNSEDSGIRFGKNLEIIANETDAKFKTDSDSVIKIPFEKKGIKFFFALQSSNKKLRDIFDRSEVAYTEEDMHGEWKSSNHSQFWTKVLELTPCDVSLIIDDCTNGTINCTKLNINEKLAKCQGKEHMWLKSNQSAWQQLNTVKCDKKTKDWAITTKNYTLHLREGAFEIRCAVEKPEEWAESATDLQPMPQIKEAMEKQKREEERKKNETKDSLLDSPFVWVGIALVGIIAIAAVLLAVGYAYRRLGRNHPRKADKSGMSKTQVDYTQLTQDPSNQSGSNSLKEGKEMEKDKKIEDEPLPTPTPSSVSQTPAAPQQANVSRLDGPNADTVNRLSIIKTLEDSKIAPIPAPPSN